MIGRRTSKLFNLHRSRNWTGLNGLVSNRRREREREEHHAGSVPKGKAIRGLRNNSSCLCGSPPLLSISISLSPSSSFLLFFFLSFFFSSPAMQRLAEDFCIDWRPTNLLRFVPLSVCLSVNDSAVEIQSGRSEEHRSAICSVNRVGLIPSVNAFSSEKEGTEKECAR